MAHHDEIIKATRDTQQDANIQSALNTANLGHHFGPKLLALTDAINSASKAQVSYPKYLLVLLFWVQ